MCDNFEFRPVTLQDIPAIGPLQPRGWSDIQPSIRFYVQSGFCRCIKVENSSGITGIGASISLGTTHWLAHIIVRETARNQGLGYGIVNRLIRDIQPGPDESVLLIATALGEPVYRKYGFRTMTRYGFFERKKPWQTTVRHPCIRSYDDSWHDSVLFLDARVTGEDRYRLLAPFLGRAVLYVDNGQLEGVYLPGLGEGPVIADTPAAGRALMAEKYSRADKAVLPMDNATGVRFLVRNGFEQVSECPRMILGQDVRWQPDKIYSRIAGNFG